MPAPINQPFTLTILPVIHVDTTERTMRNARIAAAAGCPGVFLISHMGRENEVDEAGEMIRTTISRLKVGANYLTLSPPAALERSQCNGFDFTWTDDCPREADERRACRNAITMEGHKLFAGVAFKGGQYDTDPDPGRSAAMLVVQGNIIPTTSGRRTGQAAPLEKIIKLRASITEHDPLALASGVTPENIHLYAPYVSHVLVATGISRPSGDFDPVKIAALMKAGGL